MDVVLTQTVEKLGTIGERISVADGYARNYLLPRKLAVLPTDPRAKRYQGQYQEARKAIQAQKSMVAELAQQWRGTTFTIRARAGAEGKLYGSVGVKEIKKALGRDDLDIEAPVLKTVGEHEIQLKFVDGTTIPVTIVIEPDTK